MLLSLFYHHGRRLLAVSITSSLLFNMAPMLSMSPHQRPIAPIFAEEAVVQGLLRFLHPFSPPAEARRMLLLGTLMTAFLIAQKPPTIHAHYYHDKNSLPALPALDQASAQESRYILDAWRERLSVTPQNSPEQKEWETFKSFLNADSRWYLAWKVSWSFLLQLAKSIPLALVVLWQIIPYAFAQGIGWIARRRGLSATPQKFAEPMKALLLEISPHGLFMGFTAMGLIGLYYHLLTASDIIGLLVGGYLFLRTSYEGHFFYWLKLAAFPRRWFVFIKQVLKSLSTPYPLRKLATASNPEIRWRLWSQRLKILNTEQRIAFIKDLYWIRQKEGLPELIFETFNPNFAAAIPIRQLIEEARKQAPVEVGLALKELLSLNKDLDAFEKYLLIHRERHSLSTEMLQVFRHALAQCWDRTYRSSRFLKNKKERQQVSDFDYAMADPWLPILPETRLMSESETFRATLERSRGEWDFQKRMDLVYAHFNRQFFSAMNTVNRESLLFPELLNAFERLTSVYFDLHPWIETKASPAEAQWVLEKIKEQMQELQILHEQRLGLILPREESKPQKHLSAIKSLSNIMLLLIGSVSGYSISHPQDLPLLRTLA